MEEIKLELIKKKLSDEIEFECYINKLQKNNDFYMTRKQIGHVIEYKNEKQLNIVIHRNRDIIGVPITMKLPILQKDGFTKSYNVDLYNIAQILKILSFTSQPATNDMINGLSLLAGYASVKMTSRYETDFEKILFNTFKNILVIEKQYYVGQYRLDWYIPKYNIIIECDEMNHQAYDKKEEQIRIKAINSTLSNPLWIRFNPNEDNFSIGKVLNKIMQCTIISSVESKPELKVAI